MWYGMALQSIARYKDAAVAYTRALELCQGRARISVYRQLGLLAQDQGDLAGAETWFQRSIDARPEDATGYIYLGGLWAKSGRLAEAETMHRIAVACTDGCIDEAWLNLGYVLRAQRRYLEALECFRKAIELDADYTAARDALDDIEQVLFFFPEA